MSNAQILESTTRRAPEWLGTLPIAGPWRRANAQTSCCSPPTRSTTLRIRGVITGGHRRWTLPADARSSIGDLARLAARNPH
jgi:hypothetical protein